MISSSSSNIDSNNNNNNNNNNKNSNSTTHINNQNTNNNDIIINNKNLKLNLNSSSNNSNLFKLIKTKSIKNLFLSSSSPCYYSNDQISNSSTSPTSSSMSSSSNSDLGDQRTMDAADTLVSLAHSASSTPTTEFKPFVQAKSSSIELVLNTTPDAEVIEKTIKLDDIRAENSISSNSESTKSKEMVESACKILLEQVLKSCPNVNLSSITIKATAMPSNAAIDSTSVSQALKSPKRINDHDDSSGIERLTNNTSDYSLIDVQNNNNLVKKQRTIGKLKNEKSPLDKVNLNVCLNSDNSIVYDSDNDSQLSSSTQARPAPTLATGRRSKDIELPPDESRKRSERRERNKEAAARCRRRREELTQTLSEKTNKLEQEQENLKRNYLNLMNEKTKLEKYFNDHVKNCQMSQADQNVVKVKKEEFNQILIKQSNESKNQKCQKILQLKEIEQNNNNNNNMSSSVALTPISAGFGNQIETFMSQLENQKNETTTANHNQLTRPNNLNLKNSNTNTNSNTNQMMTPTSASLTSVLQGLALAFGHHANSSNNNLSNSFSIGSNNNISLLMTPTFQLNTPTAFLSLTPIEATLNAFNTCNTPMILQHNPILSTTTTTSTTNDNSSNNNNNNSAKSTDGSNLVKL